MVSKNMANYLSRKSTISKRAKELSTLCDVDVLLILYGPDSPNIPQTLWCSQPDPGTVIDKYYAKKKPNKEVKPKGKANKKKVSRDDHQFLGKLSLDELKDLNCVLAGKIESVNQRINGIKEGNKARDYNYDGLNVEDLGCQGNNLACSSSRFVDDVTDEFNFSNKGFSNLSESLDFGFGFDGKSLDFGFGFDTDDLMIDISDLNDIKFVGDDLQLINQLATVQDVASASEFLCY